MRNFCLLIVSALFLYLIPSHFIAQITLVDYPFTGETVNPTNVPAQITASDFMISSGSITYDSVQPTSWTGSGVPYAQGAGGWGNPSSAGAKYFSFTLSSNSDSLINISHISFLNRATGAGPSALTVTINGIEVSTENVPNGVTRSYSEAFTLNAQESVEVRILGWDNGSRGTSGGGQFRIDDVVVEGEIVERPPYATLSPMLFYSEDFSKFTDSISLPVGWSVSDSTYIGDWGFGSEAGLRGNDKVLGYQHTGSTGIFTTTLRVLNGTGITLDSLRVHYTGAVERADQNRSPEWTVKIDGVTQPALSYSTAGGVDEPISAVITGISVAPDSIFELTWESDRGFDTTGSSKQIGIKNVAIQVGDQPQAGWRITDPDVLFGIDFDQTIAGVNEGQFSGNGFSPAPSNGQLNSGAWKTIGLGDGPTAFFENKTDGDFARGASTGDENIGGIYAFETSSNDFALGVKPSGSVWTPGSLTLRILNETGVTINQVQAAYELLIYNNQPRGNSFNFAYSTDDVVYTGVSLLDFISIEAAASSPEWKRNERTLNLTGLNWQDGEYLYFRWSGDDDGGGGARDEFALDNIRLIAQPSSSSIASISGEYESAALQTNASFTTNVDIDRYLRTGTGSTLEVTSGTNLHVTGSIENNGAITVRNEGSLTQEGGSDQNINNGTYNIERTGTTNTMAYNGWSSPVENAWLHDNSGVFSDANACDVFVFEASSQSWKYDFPTTYEPDCGSGPVTFTSNVIISSANGRANTGRGYFAPGGGPATRIFSGQTIHNGNINISAEAGNNPSGANWTGDDWNLIGNPYPSAFNIESFISANNSALNTLAIYVWDDDQSGSPGSSTDYIAVNSVGSTDLTGGSNNSITDYLASCQGFFVQTNGNQTISFTNGMREKGNNNQFRSGENAPSRFWLQIDNKKRTSTILLGVIHGATFEFDKKYDAPKRYAQQDLNLSAQLPSGEEMMIMGLPEPLEKESYVVPLTVQSEEGGEVSFYVPIDELFTDRFQVQLIDNVTLDTSSILKETYTAQLESDTAYADRFKLLFSIPEPEGSTGFSERAQKSAVDIYAGNGVIVLDGGENRLARATLTDLSGRLIWSRPQLSDTYYEIPSHHLNSGVYIVQAYTENGILETRKLVIK